MWNVGIFSLFRTHVKVKDFVELKGETAGMTCQPESPLGEKYSPHIQSGYAAVPECALWPATSTERGQSTWASLHTSMHPSRMAVLPQDNRRVAARVQKDDGLVHVIGR